MFASIELRSGSKDYASSIIEVHAGELLQYMIPESLSIAVCLSHIYPGFVI
jgi:hypothetical protein